VTAQDPAEFTVQLLSPAYGGESLGRLPDGRAVFVPFTLPGETAHVRLVEEHRRHARAALLQIITPAPQRIQPRCKHFTICGGCHYQNISYEDQLALKSMILREQLQRIGGIERAPVEPAVPSPRPFNYRNHVQFHLTADNKLGYYQADGAAVFAIDECHLPEEPIERLWPQLDFDGMPEIDRIGLRTGSGEEFQLILESSQLTTPEITVEGLPLSVVHLSPAGPLVLVGSGSLVIHVLERQFVVSAGSFFQVNTPVAEAMLQYLLAGLPLTPNVVLLEVYCGVGLFSAFLAPRVNRLVGIEASEAACDDFTVNLDQFENVELYMGAAGQILPFLQMQPDIILVDPPRSGIERADLQALLAMQAPFLAYISCDPATLARDARRLVGGGYSLTQITPFDLFPQTYHIESISFWER
jgi:23S rRNA (uracil1939-C5)-methyltransferase